MAETHALLSASTAHRWLVCTPSAVLERQEKVEECSVYAEEGTAAHKLAELMLSLIFGKITEEEYNQEFQNFLLRDEYAKYYNLGFVEHVTNFVNFVQDIAATYRAAGDYRIFFEQRVDFSDIVPDGFGTADVIICNDDEAHIIDLKFGQGVPVTAQNNPQLRLYGKGVLNLFPNIKTIYMTIKQPRLDSQDTEKLSRAELEEWCQSYVKPIAEMASRGEGVLHSTEHACRFCSLRDRCKERADTQMEMAKREFEILVKDTSIVPRLEPQQIADILNVASAFVDWFEDVKSFALGQSMSGVKIPGYKLVEGRSNRIITDDNAVKKILLDAGLRENEIMTEPKLQGISKLEALVGKKLFAELCKDYIIKPTGNLTLVPVGDKRPEANTIILAKKDFE